MTRPLSQETSLDILTLPTSSVKALGQATLSQAFFEGTSTLIKQAQEMGFVDEGRLPLPSVLDVIDEKLHGGEGVPDPDLSKKLDTIFRLTGLDVVRKLIPYEEIEVAVSDRGIEYHVSEDPTAADSSDLWQRFLAERALKRSQEEAERAARPLRRKQTIEKNAQARTQEAARLGKLHQAAIKKRSRNMERKRQRKLSRSREEWSARTPEIAEQLTELQREVLPLLHLPGEEGAAILGINIATLQQRVFHTRNRVGAETREDLAIWAVEHGINYDITTPLPMDEFTLRERRVAHCLGKENPDIAKELDITHKQVRTDVMSLLKKTGARNRTELALIARLYGFEPLEEELAADNAVEALKPFTKHQQPILSRLHLPYETIAGELGITRYSVQGAVGRALGIAGVQNSTGLALKLHEDGLQFDIHEPERPLHELLTREYIDICQSLELPYQEIADAHGLDVDRVNSLIGYIKAKTGARTRVELALMARIFDTGQARAIYHNIRPREERFFEALGIDPVPMEDARPWLEYATPRQAEYIEAYYFSEKQLSWRAISERFVVHRQTAMIAATRGVERIRENLNSSKQEADSSNEAAA